MRNNIIDILHIPRRPLMQVEGVYIRITLSNFLTQDCHETDTIVNRIMVINL
jgi:hypothetical protein